MVVSTVLFNVKFLRSVVLFSKLLTVDKQNKRIRQNLEIPVSKTKLLKVVKEY